MNGLRRRRPVHPFWCTQGHVCSAERGGEHRSAPMPFDTDTARVVATRVATVDGRQVMELHIAIDLPADPLTARAFVVRSIQRVLGALRGTVATS